MLVTKPRSQSNAASTCGTMIAVFVNRALDRAKLHAVRADRPRVLARKHVCTLLDYFIPATARCNIIYQIPLLGASPAHLLFRGTEHIGQITAHLALVDHTGQPVRIGQHRQQRHFGQRNRRGPVIEQQYFIICQRNFSAASSTGPNPVTITPLSPRPNMMFLPFILSPWPRIFSWSKTSSWRRHWTNPILPLHRDFQAYRPKMRPPD